MQLINLKDNMDAHFFDIDSLIDVDNKVWVVNTKKPFSPLIKIDKSDFNLIKNGIYKSQGNNIKMDNVEYWFPEDIYNKIKVSVRKSNANFTELAFSMQEFLNSSILDKVKFKIHTKNIEHLKNTMDDVYIICSKNNKKNYETIINKLEGNLEKLGIKIKDYFFVSETFYNRNQDDISYRKCEILLNSLFGYKIVNKRFTDDKLENNYDRIYYYDDNVKSIETVRNINDILHTIMDNTESYLKGFIKDNIDVKSIKLNKVNFNNVNKFDKETIYLKEINVIKTFENFKFK
jgi:hypothetical protein